MKERLERRKFIKELFGILSFGVVSILSFKEYEQFDFANLFKGLFSITSADATTLTKGTFTCAYCGKIFSDKIPESTNSFGGKDCEFRVYAVGLQPIPFFIHTCPNCGCPDKKSICQVGKNTDDNIELSNQQKMEIGKFLKSYCDGNKIEPKNFTPSQKYEVLANIFFILGRPSINIAESYLNAAWMADDEGSLERSKNLREKAIDYFVKALNNKETNAQQTQIVTYLIGELNRRIAEYDQAICWFSKVKTDSKLLANLCDQQRRLCLEKKSHKRMIKEINGNILLK